MDGESCRDVGVDVGVAVLPVEVSVVLRVE